MHHVLSKHLRILLCLTFALLAAGVAGAAPIELTCQTRDPVTGRVVLTPEWVDPAHVGVVVVDVWNFHWCKTATMRVDAIVPRMNKALEAARSLGMTVMLCPSDVVDNYVGYPQRERVLALAKVPVPTVIDVNCPPVPDAGRVQERAWRFDVRIPAGARIISLAVTDAGDGSREDFADWADAGFVVR